MLNIIKIYCNSLFHAGEAEKSRFKIEAAGTAEPMSKVICHSLF